MHKLKQRHNFNPCRFSTIMQIRTAPPKRAKSIAQSQDIYISSPCEINEVYLNEKSTATRSLIPF